MKKISLIAVPVLLLALSFFAGCSDSTDNPVAATTKYGSVYLSTTPVGAHVWMNGVLTSYVTPVRIDSLDVSRTYNFAFTLTAYDSVALTAYTPRENQLDTLKQTLSGWIVTFTSDTIWEYNSSGKSGLSLNLGTVLSVSSANTSTVDLFYSSDYYKMITASNKLTRTTWFKVGAAASLTDGVASSVKDASWTDRFSDTPGNYVFAYDQDKHYSKIIVTSRGGGSTGKPAWVILKWLYNKKVDNTTF
ncbi:MAG: hypothetical protein LWX56_05350 [Ignavibacteria bacterium]|nr:hypothetical protein [Ignavibacteria bacterium]